MLTAPSGRISIQALGLNGSRAAGASEALGSNVGRYSPITRLAPAAAPVLRNSRRLTVAWLMSLDGVRSNDGEEFWGMVDLRLRSTYERCHDHVNLLAAARNRQVVRVDPDHYISRRVRTRVAQAVQLIRRLEDHRARTGVPGDLVLQDLERTAADDHQLLVRVAVRWVRRPSRPERRNVDLEPPQIRRHVVNERTKHTGVGRPYAPRVGGEDRRSERRARRRTLAYSSCWCRLRGRATRRGEPGQDQHRRDAGDERAERGRDGEHGSPQSEVAPVF